MNAALATKLAKIEGDLHRVPKNGWNAFHKYNYAGEADVVDFVRPIMLENNLFLSFDALQDSYSIQHVDGKACVSLYIRIRIIDGDTGEMFEGGAWGYSEDKGDKAAFKAATGGKKYALMHALNIATGDDPERDPEPTPRRANAGEGQRAATSQTTAAAGTSGRTVGGGAAAHNAPEPPRPANLPFQDEAEAEEILAQINALVKELKIAPDHGKFMIDTRYKKSSTKDLDMKQLLDFKLHLEGMLAEKAGKK